MFEIYIKPDNNILKYIVEIQKFDKMKSIGEIRNAILNGNPVLTHELFHHDHNELFLKGIDFNDYNNLFYDLVKRLIDMGADITIRKNGEAISLEFLANNIKRAKEIAEEIAEEDRLRFAEEDEEDNEGC